MTRFYASEFVTADDTRIAEVSLFVSLIDISLQQTPQTGVVLTDDTRCGIDRHLSQQCQCEGFKEQSEALDLTLPWPFHCLDFAAFLAF